MKNKLLWIFLIAFIVNLALATYIQEQKEINTDKLNDADADSDKCFSDFSAGEHGCATVQTSVFANTLNVSNPWYGYVFFFVLIILFATLLVSKSDKHVKKKILKYHEIIDLAIMVILLAGTAFSAWLVYVQFYLLEATCTYCLWVDAIVIGSFILYIIVRKKLYE